MAGRFVTAGPAGARYRAYVPGPIPPGAFRPSPDIVRRLSRADRAIGELSGLAGSLPHAHLLWPPFVRREAVLSSRIEGTRADLGDVYALEAGGTPDAPDAREVANYVDALEHGLGRLETLPLSLRLIREVHARLMEGVRGGQAVPGEFRRSQNWIGPPGCTLAEARFVPPPVAEMQHALDALERYLHDEDEEWPPLARLALVHYQFEAIHPFVDGNGRVGRLLISLLLVAWGLLPLPLLSLSAYLERRREQYYDLLLAVSERAAWEEWIGFFLEGMAEQALDAVARARRLHELGAQWRERLKAGHATALTMELAESLFAAPVTSITGAAKRLGVTYRAASQNVQRLVAAGIVRPVGPASYGRLFAATELLEALSAGAVKTDT